METRMWSMLTTRPRSVTHGSAIVFEVLSFGDPAPERLRASDDTLLRVIDGLVRLTLGGAERLLGTGDEAIVPAGVPHRVESAGGDARVLAGFRPH